VPELEYVGGGHRVACHLGVDQRLRIWTNEIQPKL
jgi:peptide/nickel transport system ATP-binding protein